MAPGTAQGPPAWPARTPTLLKMRRCHTAPRNHPLADTCFPMTPYKQNRSTRPWQCAKAIQHARCHSTLGLHQGMAGVPAVDQALPNTSVDETAIACQETGCCSIPQHSQSLLTARTPCTCKCAVALHPRKKTTMVCAHWHQHTHLLLLAAAMPLHTASVVKATYQRRRKPGPHTHVHPQVTKLRWPRMAALPRLAGSAAEPNHVPLHAVT